MTAPTDGPSPKLSVSSRGVELDLFGATTRGRPNRPAWRIEVTGICPANPPGPETATHVTVTLINAENGVRIGRTTVPFAWLRDVAFGSTTTVEIREGDFR